MTSLLNTIQMALWNISDRMNIMDVIDILLVSFIIYELIILVRKTRGSALLKGLVLLLLAVGISDLMGLTAMNWLLKSVIGNGALVLIILFQPELRKALESIGSGAFFEKHRAGRESTERERIIDELVRCMLALSRRRVGALIVFERRTGLQDVIETGTPIDSMITAPLLENIFEPNTPLHDGAVIIRGERVVAAACILPLTERQDINKELGTRHRAGIGISEATDALVLIASEETGVISIAQGGTISRRLDEDALRKALKELYEEPAPTWTRLLHLEHRRKETV